MSEPTGMEAFRAHLDALAAELPGPLEGRREALECALSRGFPTRREEDWRFTSLQKLAELPFEPAVPPARRAGTEPELEAGLQIALLNGHWDESASRLSPSPAGVSVEALATALDRNPELASDIGTLADGKQRALTALNRALFADGARIEVAENVSVAAPIAIVSTVAPGKRPIALHPRHLISVGAGSRVTLIEYTRGEGTGPSLANPVTELWLGRDTRVDHVLLQDDSSQGNHLALLCVHQEAGSHFTQHSIALGGALARFEIQCVLAGEGAHAELRGLYLGRDSQLLDHHTTIEHATPHTTSNELYKGILDGRAGGVFHGRIHVRPHAQKIAALQRNRNLLLSDQASIHTKPQLEIHADDVRCTHGATIGQLDPDQLHYLRSRGISEHEARALLTWAFASEIVQTLPQPELRGRIERRVLEWLPRAGAA